VPDELARIAYEASLRSLDKQEEVVAELRARTGLILAASSLAASFLGEPAITEGALVLVAVALAAFAVSLGASLYVLLPKGDLVFSLKGSNIYEELFDFAREPSEAQRRLAYVLDSFWDGNDLQLDRLRAWFHVAVVGLAAELVLLLVSVGGTLV
jgi:hypothetical protein